MAPTCLSTQLVWKTHDVMNFIIGNTPRSVMTKGVSISFIHYGNFIRGNKDKPMNGGCGILFEGQHFVIETKK